MENQKSKGENPASRRSKTALMVAFTELLTERDISEISISEITDRAGLSRQTFYTNFTKKEDILDDTVRRLFEMYAEHISGMPLESEMVIEDYFCFWGGHSVFLSVLFRSNLGHLFFTRNTKFFESELDALSQTAAEEEREVPYIRAFLASTLFSILRVWIVNGQDMGAAQLTVFVKGLLEGRVLK